MSCIPRHVHLVRNALQEKCECALLRGILWAEIELMFHPLSSIIFHRIVAAKIAYFLGFQVLFEVGMSRTHSHIITANMYNASTCSSYNISQHILFILYEQPIVETLLGFLYRWQNLFRETVTWLRLSKLVPEFEAMLFLPAFIVFNLHAEA